MTHKHTHISKCFLRCYASSCLWYNLLTVEANTLLIQINFSTQPLHFFNHYLKWKSTKVP